MALPNRRGWGPDVAQPLLIGVTVLRDDRSDALRVSLGKPEADRRAKVENIDGEAIKPDYLGKAVNDNGDVVERLSELAPRWHARRPNPGRSGAMIWKRSAGSGDEVPELWPALGKP
jgi:hypothetical protein